MGRFWDRHRLLIRIEDVEMFTLGERGFLWRKRNRAGSAGKTGTEERVRVAVSGVSSVSGRSVEQSGAERCAEQGGWDVY